MFKYIFHSSAFALWIRTFNGNHQEVYVYADFLIIIVIWYTHLLISLCFVVGHDPRSQCNKGINLVHWFTYLASQHFVNPGGGEDPQMSSAFNSIKQRRTLRMSSTTPIRLWKTMTDRTTNRSTKQPTTWPIVRIH